ncbi:MAG: aminotransferase class IV [Luteimonas sp.]
MTGTIVYCNGRPATVEDLTGPALRNDGHFTTFQLRGRAVRGFALHLQRLDEASRALFDTGLDPDRVRQAVAAAVIGTATQDATVRVTVVPQAGSGPSGLDVLVSIAPPADPAPAPLRLRSFVFQRDTAALKHVGTFPLFQHQRLARRMGDDDALFVAPDGLVIEGSVWNVGLWDGATMVWPRADALRGTQERLLQAGLDALGIEQVTRPVMLSEFDAGTAAFACNARGQRLIGSVDGRLLGQGAGLPALLARALDTQPWVPVA